jgi:hypothetical protein
MKRLTDEEILKAFNSAQEMNEYTWTNHLKGIAQAQFDADLKDLQAEREKIANYLEEPCTEHKIDTGIIMHPFYKHPDTHDLYYSQRKDCPQCWQKILRGEAMTKEDAIEKKARDLEESIIRLAHKICTEFRIHATEELIKRMTGMIALWLSAQRLYD